MQKATPLQKKLWVTLMFLLKFSILALPMYLILWSNFDTYPLQEAAARDTYEILSLFQSDITLDGIIIYTNTYAFEFLRDCTAWKSILAFIALVLATPFTTLRSKSIAILWAVPAIQLINLLRTVSTIYIGIISPSTVGIVHTFLWREGLIFIIFLMWYLWFRASRNYSLEKHTYLDKITAYLSRRA